MPYLRISTTRALQPEERAALRGEALAAMVAFGKPREAVMVELHDGIDLQRGTQPNACAFCEARVLGGYTRLAADELAMRLSASVARIARTDPMCVYFSIASMDACYTDGKTPPGKHD